MMYSSKLEQKLLEWQGTYRRAIALVCYQWQLFPPATCNGPRRSVLQPAMATTYEYLKLGRKRKGAPLQFTAPLA